MALNIGTSQYARLQQSQLRRLSGEIADALRPLLGPQVLPNAPLLTEAFVLQQISTARRHGLNRRDEITAWVSCALIYGQGFEQVVPEIEVVVAEPHYDRAMMLTLVAVRGLRREGLGP